MAGGGSAFVGDLGLVLLLAAAGAGLARRLRQPPVVGYLLAGVVVGPKFPVPLFADPERVAALSEFGVILVLFAVGLEFRIRHLLALLPKAGVVAAVQIGTLGLIGALLGALLGFSSTTQLFLAAGTAISSTMVSSRAMTQHPVGREARELVLGVLVIQDVVAVAMLALLAGLSAGKGEETHLLPLLAQLGAALSGLLLAGLVVVPALARFVLRKATPEIEGVTAAALAFAFAAAAQAMGYSTALGAFIGGVACAEAGLGHALEQRLSPLRDLFAAIFFASVGMSIDPVVALQHLPAALSLAGLIVLGQLGSVGLGGVLAGNSLRTSIKAGLALGQIGEFSFLLGSLGQAAGAPAALPALLVGASLVTTTSTPWLLARQEPITRWIDARLPHRLQAVLGLVESWLVELRQTADRQEAVRLVRQLLVDLLVVAAGLAFAGAARGPLSAALQAQGVGPDLARLAVPTATLLVLTPVFVGLARTGEALAQELAQAVLPDAQRAGRALLASLLRLTLLLAIGLPLAAALEPWLGLGRLVVLPLGALSILLARRIWREAADVEASMRSGASEFLDLLAPSADHPPGPAPTSHPPPPSALLNLAGLAEVRPYTLGPSAWSVGRTLAEVNLRARTGASVVAIGRPDQPGVVTPTGHEALRAGDRLALLGGDAAAAEALLQDGPAEEADAEPEPADPEPS